MSYAPNYDHLQLVLDDDGQPIGVSNRRLRRAVTKTDRYVAVNLQGPSTRAIKRVSGGRTR